MKTYISPVARVIALYDEAELMQTMSVDITEENVDDSDKSNRRSGIWDEF